MKKRKSKKSKMELWVIKIGSQLIAEGGALLVRSFIQQIAELKQKENVQIVWVSSGAIASARQRLHLQWKTLPEKQALSAIGQPMLMELYTLGFQAYGLNGAQVLLSYSDFKRSESRNHFCNTISKLLEWGVVPVLNENDAVATDEIQFGDNDQLSAMVACELKASRLVILTNVGGLYDRNPSELGAQLISNVDKVTPQLIKKVKSSSASAFGKGGMESKLLAAQKSLKNGIPVFVVNGFEPHVLTRLWEGEKVGTQFGPNS